MQELQYTSPFVLIGDDGLAHRVYEGYVQSREGHDTLWRVCDNKIFIRHLRKTFASALKRRLAAVPTCVHCVASLRKD